MLEISSKAREALDAICDTFVPGEAGLPSATSLGVPEAVLTAVGSSPSAVEQQMFAGLLDSWDPGFAGLSAAKREAALLSWCDSQDVGQRAAFQALRKGILLSYYCLPWQGEGPNPVDDALGYPGPLGPPSNPPPKTVSPLSVDSDTELSCDVVIVGLGAGGGTAAGVLAAAGLDVIVVEAGGYFSGEGFGGAELSRYARLYLKGGGGAPRAPSHGAPGGGGPGGGGGG